MTYENYPMAAVIFCLFPRSVPDDHTYSVFPAGGASGIFDSVLGSAVCGQPGFMEAVDCEGIPATRSRQKNPPLNAGPLRPFLQLIFAEHFTAELID